MDNSNNTFLTVHQIDKDGTITSYQCEDFISQELVSITLIPSDDINLNSQNIWNHHTANDKVNLSYYHLEPQDESLTMVKIDEDELVEPPECKHKILNIPILARCQNCNSIFPTKYQYQRHQCEFNADNAVLKADVGVKDADKRMRIKYDCSICGRQFIIKQNFERHQLTHTNTQENVCEHCNKKFVSVNRLRIHKENHCKKAGDISKFYLSDVTAWKCIKCNQVFAMPASANRHAENCMEIMKNNVSKDAKSGENSTLSQDYSTCIVLEIINEESSNTKPDSVAPNVEQVSAKLLLQCEYCNCTYCNAHLLLAHQKKHTTDVNYECVTCKKTFGSYTSAVKHWTTQCSDEVNLLKMTYCEHCNQIFKSHETLYAHKKQKKHYTPKPHVLKDDNLSNKTVNYASKKGLMEFTRNILTATDVLNNSDKEIDNKENENPNKIQEDEVVIKEKEGSKLEMAAQDLENQKPRNKKRGPKRKWPKPLTKTKCLSLVLDEGYKYQCEHCILVFENIHDLEAHREKEHALTFSCEECGKIVHSAKDLDIHNRKHQNGKPYLCELCGKSYRQNSHLLQHMRSHQGIKPFPCPYKGCEVRYTISADLKNHIRTVHTRERPFKCSVCNKSFLTDSVYYQHRKIHTNDRRYECDICGRKFQRSGTLNCHRRIHTGEKPYFCEICEIKFRTQSSKMKHVSRHHCERDK